MGVSGGSLESRVFSGKTPNVVGGGWWNLMFHIQRRRCRLIVPFCVCVGGGHSFLGPPRGQDVRPAGGGYF